MTSFRYVISVKDGLHARNAMELSRAAGAYKCSITLQSSSVWEKSTQLFVKLVFRE